MAKKKELIKIPDPSNRGAALAHRLRQNHESAHIYSVSEMMTKWRYIDFLNPNDRLPCLAMEWLFGARGLLAGRIIQLRAKYSKGKSSLMYLMYAAAQALSNAWCFHVESEGAMAPADFVASYGCDPEQLIIEEITTLEDCTARLDEIIAEVRGGFGGSKTKDGKPKASIYKDPFDASMESPILIGIDSLSSLGLSDAANQDIADLTTTPAMALHARKLREYLRNRVGRFNHSQALVMLASHETSTISKGGPFAAKGSDKSALANEAIGIHATYVLDIDSNVWYDKELGERVGDKVTIETAKNKLSPRGRKLTMYLRWGSGFDLLKTDMDFLMSHSGSPFIDKELYRHGHGISCKMLTDKTIKSDEEFLRMLYNNQDVVMMLRERMRVRGCGFDFEAKYMPSLEEVEDNKNSEESDVDGVAGTKEEA